MKSAEMCGVHLSYVLPQTLLFFSFPERKNNITIPFECVAFIVLFNQCKYFCRKKNGWFYSSWAMNDMLSMEDRLEKIIVCLFSLLELDYSFRVKNENVVLKF